MKVIIGYDSHGKALAEYLINGIQEMGIEVSYVENKDKEAAYWCACSVAKAVQQNPEEVRGIIVDKMGVEPFMVASKFKGIRCAALCDEHSAKMTRSHNDANVITLGSSVVGYEIAKSIVIRFLSGEYAGGRHHIRIDMLDKMGGES